MQRLANHHLKHLPDRNEIASAGTFPDSSGKGGAVDGKAGPANVIDYGGEMDGDRAGFRPPSVSVGKTKAIIADGNSLLQNRKKLENNTRDPKSQPSSIPMSSSNIITIPNPLNPNKKQKGEQAIPQTQPPPSWFPSDVVGHDAFDNSDAAWWAELARPGAIGSALPPMPHSRGPLHEEMSAELANSNDGQGSHFETGLLESVRPSETLSKRISHNITVMRNMRESASLLTTVANGATADDLFENHPQYLAGQINAAQGLKELYSHSKRTREFKRERKRSGLVINEEVAANQLRMATGVMLSHAGFEGESSQ